MKVQDLPKSVLDLCSKALPSRSLIWHYRSRHEQLISFSNTHFYHGGLRTFPSPDDNRRAVRFEHVPHGVYDAGRTRTNRVEAERVADEIVAFRRANPNISLGVVTFSEAQMVVVQHELDRRKRDDPSLEELLSEEGPEGFFVKNLENVQGDERDIVFFSIGFGKDRAGRFSHFFGPLNQAGGERRLNVAITRARLEVVVFASFLPEDIDLRRTNSEGLRLLKEYLHFALRGNDRPSQQRQEIGAVQDNMIQDVALALERQGHHVVSHLGAGDFPIDIAIRDPVTDQYLIAVECDGDGYYSLPTVRERERLRPLMLENLGWQVHRVRSMDWLRDKPAELARLQLLIEQTFSATPG